MNELTGSVCISGRQNNEFATLSGDYNPLHIDPIYSRRLQFGQPVIHGIHHMLRTWDAACTNATFSPNTHIAQLSATFPNPVTTNQAIDYSCRISSDQSKAELSAYCGKKLVLSLTLTFSILPDAPVNVSVLNELPPIEKPLDQAFPPEHTDGACPLYLDERLANTLFPNLAKYYPSHLLAQIITCTRIVGMKCPGLHSIFSKIKLNFHSDAPINGDRMLHYFEQHKDSRVHILKLGVKSQGMEGTLDTFFRPTPVTQPSFAEIRTRIPGNSFSMQRVLVIGGSRGVGETTAKILGAGGADVVITYNKGQEEAEKVADEINQGNARCRIMEFNVTELSKQSAELFEGGLLPTHVYYFASPRILANRVKVWDEVLYTKFCRFYLNAFTETVKLFAEAAEKTRSEIGFFYPSSIYINQPERGFSEYAVAKGAGEALCIQLAARYRYSTFFSPRLPRMSTDQTSSIIPIRCASVFDTMHKEIVKMLDQNGNT